VSVPASMAAMEAAVPPQLYDCRDAYSLALEEMASIDSRVCAVVNDSLSSTKLKGFASSFPHRFINVGTPRCSVMAVMLRER
jgi:transketolase